MKLTLKVKKIIIIIILIIIVLICSFFGWKSIKGTNNSSVLFSKYEFDNTKNSKDDKSENNLTIDTDSPVENRKDKNIDFKIKLYLPKEVQNISTVTNIPPIATEDVLYEFNITQNTGEENLVVYKFFIYKTSDYEQLSDNIKQTRFMIKRYDEYGYCLAYETIPVNFGDNEVLWNDYVAIYNSLDSVIESISIKK